MKKVLFSVCCNFSQIILAAQMNFFFAIFLKFRTEVPFQHHLNEPENCFGSPVQYGVPHFLIAICILLLMISLFPYIESCIPFCIWSNIGTKQWLALGLAVVATTDVLEGGRLMRTSSLLLFLFFKKWGCSIYSLYIHISPFAELCSNQGASTKV